MVNSTANTLGKLAADQSQPFQVDFSQMKKVKHPPRTTDDNYQNTFNWASKYSPYGNSTIKTITNDNNLTAAKTQGANAKLYRLLASSPDKYHQEYLKRIKPTKPDGTPIDTRTPFQQYLAQPAQPKANTTANFKRYTTNELGQQVGREGGGAYFSRFDPTPDQYAYSPGVDKSKQLFDRKVSYNPAAYDADLSIGSLI